MLMPVCGVCLYIVCVTFSLSAGLSECLPLHVSFVLAVMCAALCAVVRQDKTIGLNIEHTPNLE